VERGVQLLGNRVRRAFDLTQDLFEHLPESGLRLDLAGLPSNTLGAQVWCLIGARESYLRALVNGAWSGFRCGLSDRYDKALVAEALRGTSTELQAFLHNAPPLTEVQLDLLVDLLEHEVQHHGQLIRYVYANGLSFPLSWNKRYTI